MAIEIASRNPLAFPAKTAAEQTPAAQFIRHTRVPTLAFNNTPVKLTVTSLSWWKA